MTGKEGVRHVQFFQLALTVRGLTEHTMKVSACRLKMEILKNFSCVMKVRQWNFLPQSAIEVKTVNAFTNSLDKVEIGAI